MSDRPSNESPPVGAGDGGAAWDRLQGLLQRQLALVRQGRLASAVELFDQTDRCVREIARTSRPTCQRQGVEHLYRELSLALAAQRAEVAVALKAIRRGRRALNVYSSATFLRR